MKLRIIFGNDIEESRKRFIEIIEEVKKRNWEVIYIKEVQNGGVLDSLLTRSLFGGETLYVLEDINLLGKGDLEWFSKKSKTFEASFLIWHKGEFPVRFKKYFPKDAVLQNFDLPREVFKFLDSLVPGNSKNSLRLLHEILERENVEFLLAMMARHFRDLYIVKEDLGALGYPSWRENKLLGQANKLGKMKIKRVIEKLAVADVEAKTGGIPLLTSIDLIIARELE